MIEEQLKRNRRHFELIGATICSQYFGSLLWAMNRPDNDEFASGGNLDFIFYTLLTFTCYLGVYWLLDRYLPSIGKTRPNWALISLLGTSLAFIIITLLQVFDGWHPRLTTSEFVAERFGLLVPLNVWMLSMMTIIWVIGFIVRLVMKEIDGFKVLPD